MINNEPGNKGFHMLFNAKTAPHSEAIRYAIETSKPPYTITRGLKTKTLGGEQVLGYNETLPKFKGKNLGELIKLLHEKEFDTLKLADIGYGTGHLLIDVTEEFKFIQALGFGRSAYAKLSAPEFGITPTLEQLSKNPRIKLVEGDLPFTSMQVASGSQNIVLLNNVLLYVPMLEKRIIQDVHQILTPDGIGLLNQVSLEEKAILELLIKLGVTRENIEIKKSDNPDIGKTLAFMK